MDQMKFNRATTSEIANDLGFDISDANELVEELVEMGELADTGQRRLNPVTREWEVVWTATELMSSKFKQELRGRAAGPRKLKEKSNE